MNEIDDDGGLMPVHIKGSDGDEILCGYVRLRLPQDECVHMYPGGWDTFRPSKKWRQKPAIVLHMKAASTENSYLAAYWLALTKRRTITGL
jgi:hypothetical protein